MNQYLCDLNLDGLDGADADSLMAFWNRYQRGRHYRDFFPGGGKGTKRATADLANYASNKATAMGCRARGDAAGALMYEGIADRIYKGLPPAARW